MYTRTNWEELATASHYLTAEEVPSISRSYLESVWEKCLARAIKQAELEMGKKPELSSLSWEEVFEDEYYLH